MVNFLSFPSKPGHCDLPAFSLPTQTRIPLGLIILRPRPEGLPSQTRQFPGTRRQVAGARRPAQFVGGDYYDFLSRPDSDLWFTVGDVSGKGIAAAVLMASLQASLRSQINGRPDSVANVVSELNQALCLSFSQERYTTHRPRKPGPGGDAVGGDRRGPAPTGSRNGWRRHPLWA